MPKILLVEDNEMNRDMLLRRLIRRGGDVRAQNLADVREFRRSPKSRDRHGLVMHYVRHEGGARP